MTKTTLLPLLASGEFRSGQELAAALGVSRTAVWKQLNNTLFPYTTLFRSNRKSVV